MAEDEIGGYQATIPFIKSVVNELKGKALDYAVAQASHHKLKPLPSGEWVDVYGPDTDEIEVPIQNYSSSSILAIDLIKEQFLEVIPPQRATGNWVVNYRGSKDYAMYRAEDFELEVAVARCFVKSKRGEYLMVPLSLLDNEGVRNG